MKRIVIIGGGASGLAAAVTAAEQGCDVTVLEQKEKTGKKILATGNGRCNLTNLQISEVCYRSRNQEFPMKVIRQVSVEETLKFFNQLGLLTKDRNGYVYPVSDQASSVAELLAEAAKDRGAKLVCSSRVTAVDVRKKGFRVTAMETEGEKTYDCDKVILASGSKASPVTGSDGSGYILAKELGHHVIEPLPALVQLVGKGGWLRRVAGVRTEATVTLMLDGIPVAEDRGELQLTDYGISGIPVFQVSRYASVGLYEGKQVRASIDFLPFMEQNKVTEFLFDRRERLSYLSGAKFLSGVLAEKLACVLLSEAGISLTDQVKQIPDRKLEKLAALAKGFSLLITGTKSFEQAQICCGGVDTSQVDSRTMESRILPGFYLTGEILDVDGICGGYNLQWAWSTGILAGRAAAGANKETRKTDDQN